MSFDFQWTVTPAQAFGVGMQVYINRIRQGVRDIAHRRAPQIEDWMKSNHPWQNQTGDAEAGLYTEVEEIALDMVDILLSHGDDIHYGIYLETKFGGRDSVLTPALDYWSQVIWDDVREMMR